KRQMRRLRFQGDEAAVGGHRIRPLEPCGNVPALRRVHWMETQERTGTCAIGSRIELLFAPAQTSSRSIGYLGDCSRSSLIPMASDSCSGTRSYRSPTARVSCARPQVRQIATGEEDMKHDLPENSAGEMANAVARLSGLIKEV